MPIPSHVRKTRVADVCRSIDIVLPNVAVLTDGPCDHPSGFKTVLSTEVLDRVDRFPPGLGRVARVAPGPKVVEIQPKVRPHRYRDLMVGVQVTLALTETLPQLGEHLFDGRQAQFELPEVPDQIRLPPTVSASPLITDEAKNPQAPMLGVVTAGC
jgi:hypothetical protein